MKAVLRYNGREKTVDIPLNLKNLFDAKNNKNNRCPIVLYEDSKDYPIGSADSRTEDGKSTIYVFDFPRIDSKFYDDIFENFENYKITCSKIAGDKEGYMIILQ